MKKVIVPIKEENCINLIEITKHFDGLIVCKINDDIKGIIIWIDGEWSYLEYVDIDRNFMSDYNLIDLINELIKKFPNMEFFTT